jgi:arginyl-tRNA synthetase
MILSVQRQVHDAIADLVQRQFGVEAPDFSVEVPPNRALGDLAVTVAFQLARTLRKAPRAIAQELAAALPDLRGIARTVAAPNGYLNFYLDRPAFLRTGVGGGPVTAALAGGKTVVEHTAINPNKAAHIGHLRNAVLGDTLARVLRFGGTSVEVQNYIDDTGVQVADVVVGFMDIEQRSLEDVRRIADTTRFDYYCWDLYSRVTDWYENDKAHLEVRARTLHDLEHGGNDRAALGAFIVERIVQAHLQTMRRLGIAYDLLTYEGDILRLSFWARTFEILKAQRAVYLQTEGRLAGCWVMKIDEGADQSDSDDDPEGREKVIVRSNGVVTYVGKDIANQFWKFGLLGRDFHYRSRADLQPDPALWATTSVDGAADHPPFGRAERIYNVIDSRQMYLQALLSQALRALGHPRESENSIHFSYEMVALSKATATALGYETESGGDGASKPFVEVSGRKGLGVKIDDLMDLVTAKAAEEVEKRNPGWTLDEYGAAAGQIAVAAVRYFMLKFSRGKLIVFDMEEALAFEGETGPYLQYAWVRASNILRKLQEREGTTRADVLAALRSAATDELETDASAGAADHDLWAVVLEAARLDEMVELTIRSLEFSTLAKYAFGLAQKFNAFYHQFQILNEEDAAKKVWRAAGVMYFSDQLRRALDLMGIEVPTRM